MTNRWVDNVVTGIVMAVAFTMIVIGVSVAFGGQQRDTMESLERSNTRMAAAIICGISAPLEETMMPDGTVAQVRSEGFVNRTCLVALGFEAVDLNGDGAIEP
jgi:hypothetical protein